MKEVKAKCVYVTYCNCDNIIWLESSDFLLLNCERICYYECESCGEKIKIVM